MNDVPDDELDDAAERRDEPVGRRTADYLRAMAAAVIVEPTRVRRVRFLIGVVVGVAILGMTAIVGCTRQEATDAADYADCREGNLPNAYLRIRAAEFRIDRHRPRASRVLPILWCRRTVDLDRPVRLRPADEQAYIDTVRRERLPIVDDQTGRVIDSEPLPAPPRR